MSLSLMLRTRFPLHVSDLVSNNSLSTVKSELQILWLTWGWGFNETVPAQQ